MNSCYKVGRTFISKEENLAPIQQQMIDATNETKAKNDDHWHYRKTLVHAPKK